MRAVSEGKGVCRDFATSLEYGLEYLVDTHYTGEGIKVDCVVNHGHMWVRVNNFEQFISKTKRRQFMSKNILTITILLTIGLLLEPCVSSADQTDSIIKANNEFAIDLYSRYKSEEGNVFFSPFSISSAIAMTYEGARAETADQIKEVFHFPEDTNLLREAYLSLYNEINREDKKYTLSTANALWAQKDYKFLDEYFSLVDKYYAGKVTNLDFISKTEEARITINTWVEKKTNNRIKDLIPKGMLSPLSRLVLTNAVYFKGFWFKQFNKDNTKEEDFTISKDSTIKVQMMHLTDMARNLRYAETDNLQILELPYEARELSMLILLPKEDDISSIEADLNIKNLLKYKKLLKPEKVELSLPRFKFETKYFMAKDLVRMGITDAFTLGIDFGGKADFSGMTGDRLLNISEVIHQAFVEVNEEGTEAAAATAVVMKVGCAGPMPPPVIKVFKANHPFIFIIQQQNTGNILFIGRVNNPTE